VLAAVPTLVSRQAQNRLQPLHAQMQSTVSQNSSHWWQCLSFEPRSVTPEGSLATVPTPGQHESLASNTIGSGQHRSPTPVHDPELEIPHILGARENRPPVLTGMDSLNWPRWWPNRSRLVGSGLRPGWRGGRACQWAV